MQATSSYINIRLKAEEIIYSFQEGLKSYNKLRLKGRGTKGDYYFINVPKLYVGERYSPDKKFSISFGFNKKNNHQLVVIDLDDQQTTKNWLRNK